MARAIAYRFQQKVHGGLKPQTMRLLRTMAKPGAEPPRQVKVGSVIMREHKGVLHEVMVVPDGFCWRGQTYASLSTIAKKITGVNWNGPRFFGLRDKTAAGTDASSDEGGAKKAVGADEAPRGGRSGRRSSIGAGASS